jgi:hypothetical protein
MTDRKGRSRTEKERQKMNVSTGINKFQEITMTPNRKKNQGDPRVAQWQFLMSKSRILKFHFSRKSNLGNFIKDSAKSKQIPT